MKREIVHGVGAGKVGASALGTVLSHKKKKKKDVEKLN
jgi:hypothetical protein